jgi:hypothetical protein
MQEKISRSQPNSKNLWYESMELLQRQPHLIALAINS